MCLSFYLKISVLLPETHLIFYLALLVFVCQQQRLWPDWTYCMRRYLDNYYYYFSTNALLITGSISFYLQRALQQKFVVGRYGNYRFGFKTLHLGLCLMILNTPWRCNVSVYMKSKVVCHWIYPNTVFSERRNDLIYP